MRIRAASHAQQQPYGYVDNTPTGRTWFAVSTATENDFHDAKKRKPSGVLGFDHRETAVRLNSLI